MPAWTQSARRGVGESETTAGTESSAPAATATAQSTAKSPAAEATDDVTNVAKSATPDGAASETAGAKIRVRTARPVAVVFLQDFPQHPAVEHAGQELAKQDR